MLNELEQRGIAPANPERLLEALRLMNEVAHGFSVDASAVSQAVSIAKAFLGELTARSSSPGS